MLMDPSLLLRSSTNLNSRRSRMFHHQSSASRILLCVLFVAACASFSSCSHFTTTAFCVPQVPSCSSTLPVRRALFVSCNSNRGSNSCSNGVQQQAQQQQQQQQQQRTVVTAKDNDRQDDDVLDENNNNAPHRHTHDSSSCSCQQRQHHRNQQWNALQSVRQPSTRLGGIFKSVAIGTAAALVSAFVFPHAAHASVDPLLSLAGGATALVGQTNGFLSGLAETGFYQAFSLVFLSEIGDKTFFIAGLLSMKTGRLISFVGSMAALAAMTIVSVVIGQIFHAVPSGIADGIPLDDVAACLAFAFFGLKTLKEAFDLDEGESVMEEELAEAEEAVEESETVVGATTPWGKIASIFALVFAAEFGDRSFLSTIALSAAQNPVSVAGGAIAAHAVATAIAVQGASYVSKYVSEKAIGIIGGSLFLVFAVTTALGIF